MSSPAVAACLIVRDGEATLERCIRSIRQHVAEVDVWLDSRTTDGSAGLLHRLAAEPGTPIRVERGDWPAGGFAAAREASFAMASPDVEWLLWLDDDDFVCGGGRLGEVVQRAEGDVDFAFARTEIDDRLAGRLKVSWRTRIARRGRGLRWRGVIHETLEPPAGREVAFTVASPAALVFRHEPVEVAGRHDHFALTAAAVPDDPRLLRPLAQELLNRGRLEQAADALERYLVATAGDWSQAHARLEILMQLATVRAQTDVLAGVEVIRRRDAERAAWIAAADSGTAAGFAALGPDFWADVDAAFAQLGERARRAGRNEPCPCDSGLKAKRCCGPLGPVALSPVDVRRALVAATAASRSAQATSHLDPPRAFRRVATPKTAVS